VTTVLNCMNPQANEIDYETLKDLASGREQQVAELARLYAEDQDDRIIFYSDGSIDMAGNLSSHRDSFARLPDSL
jgi:hypothetical protein